MCGFAGIVGTSARVREETLAVMGASLAHRGPDDEGSEIFPLSGSDDQALGLVHRRLSIIDLSDAAHQPMTDERTGNRIVYNGEIYNYQELRRELLQLGCTFRSHSDTEVILKAYHVYGADCLDRFRGMFAFALWDAGRERLFLAVDRFGIKPLYVCESNGLFMFASELRTLLKSGLVPKEIDPLGVASFLAQGAVQAPLTIIKNVRAMLPGQALTYDVRNRSVRRFDYWRLTQASAALRGERDEHIVEQLRDILANSVSEHLVSDVPVGLFLSGGIDSSTIVALANHQREETLQSFSVIVSEDRFSEEKYSDLIAERYCRQHTRIRLDENHLAGLLPGALEAMDQPTIDGVNTYAIAQAVRQAGIKVALSGQGGDEIFGGYPSFARVPGILKAERALGYIPRFLRSGGAELADVILRQRWIGSKIAQLLRYDHDMLDCFLTFRQLFGPRTCSRLLRRGHPHGVVNGLTVAMAEDLRADMNGLDPVACISLLETRLFLANTLMRDGDFMSMAHGLEVRVPFLDHRLVEFVFALDSGLKTARGVSKPLLAGAMSDRLPEEIRRRPKIGFFLPWELWLRQRFRLQTNELFENLPDDNELGLNATTCRTLWHKFLAGAPGVKWTGVWAIHALVSWYDRNIRNV